MKNIAFPGDARCWEIDDQYMFGGDILVAPVLRAGETERGVYLPTGVALEVDGGAVGRIPFMRCLPQICMAFGEAGNQTLDKFKKGTAANFIIYEAPGIGMPIKISLNGFAAAFTALGKL